MGHAAPISLGAGCFRLGPRRPGVPGLFGGGPSAACSAEATGWWLPVLADPASDDGGGWCRLTEPSHSCWEASHARRAWASSKSTRAVRASSGSVRVTHAASIAEVMSRSARSPHAGQSWVRWARGFGTRSPHRQCWLSAVDRVPARYRRPPVAAHSAASAATSMPGLNSAIRLPHSRAQVEIEQSSTVMVLPWVATIRAATSRARVYLAWLVVRARRHDPHARGDSRARAGRGGKCAAAPRRRGRAGARPDW
jgi:hypothetical protein